MNIFATDKSPVVSAKNLPNILVNKMALESAQLLSTAHIVIDGVQIGYRKTHENHPSAVWARESAANYEWLYEHFKALCAEYTFRTGKIHECEVKLMDVLSKPPKNCPHIKRSKPPKCMPEEHKVECVYQSYRNYLTAKFKAWAVRDKPLHVKWDKRGSPSWLPQYHVASTQGRVLVLKRL